MKKNGRSAFKIELGRSRLPRIKKRNYSPSKIKMSTTENNNNTASTKPTFVSALAPTSEKIAKLIAEKHEADLKFKKELARLTAEMVSTSTKIEKQLAKFLRSAENRRNRPKNPAHSVVGVNQPKTLHPELLAFLRANAGNMSEKARGLVNDIMSLNQVKQCVQSLGIWAKVINDKSEYDFSAAEGNQAYVASMRRLLGELAPADYYKDAKGDVISINFGERIKTNRITKFFDHLLTTTDASKAFTAQRIEELTAAAATAAAAAAAVPVVVVEDAAMAVETPAAPAAAEATAEAPAAAPKRKIARKASAATVSTA